MTKSNEPIIWSLFAAGGMVAALLMPVTIVLTGFCISCGYLSEEKMLAAIRHPLGRLYLAALIILPLFHAAHRLRHTAMDMGMRSASKQLGVLLYGGAIAASICAIYALVTLPS